MGYAHDYATAILRRGRDPMPPADFTPDWSDAPRRTKVYPDTLAVPLPGGSGSGWPSEATVDSGLFGRPDGGRTWAPFTLDRLGGMLRHSYGLLGRRLGVQANSDLASLPVYSHANWHRGTASGGGLYPCSVYWVAGPGTGVTPGVYHYRCTDHAAHRLLAGPVSALVREALGTPTTADNFLIVGVKFWQNAFKYNNFSYHAVSMDVGTLLQTWRMWAAATGTGPLDPVLWFDQAALGDLLGLPAGDEGLFAVVPLDWQRDGEPRSGGPGGTRRDGARPRVRRADQERSRRVLTFDALRRIHASTAGAASHRPPAGALAAAGALPPPAEGDRISLPAPAAMDTRLDRALRQRRSSFGRFEAARPISGAQLAASLAASAAGSLPCEITTGGDPPLAKLYAFVNHVEGIPAGSYEYLPGSGQLRLIDSRPPGEFLQRNYFLANYNLEQAAAVLVPTIRVHAALDAAGDRAYNVVNATVGAVAQNFYTAAAALGLGAGVALGFDNISYVEHLGLAGTGEAPLLIMLIGHERRHGGDFRYELR